MYCDNRRLLLRRATADAHQTVENAAGDTATQAGYRRYLAGLYAFRTPIETALQGFAWPAWLGGWRPILISPSIADDLTDIDGRPGDIDPEAATPVSNDTSELLGTLYVIEGSSLGARIILRHARDLGFHETHGARHLSAQTGSTQNWKDFIALLDHAPDFDLKRAARAANQTFLGAADAFQRAQHTGA